MKVTPEGIAFLIVMILNVFSIFDKASILREKADAPQKEMEKKLEKMQDEIDEINNKLKNDDWRIIRLENGGRVLMRSIGALLTHGIDGNNIEEMKLAREELNEYLIQR